MVRSLRIAEVAPPFEAVPPRAYGGTERVVHALVAELADRGHRVTLFASGDSSVPVELVPTVPRALWSSGAPGSDAAAAIERTLAAVRERAGDFDVIHCHLEWAGLRLAETIETPVVVTMHGRLDQADAAVRLGATRAVLVAVSAAQAATQPAAAFTVVHNGLRFGEPGSEVPVGDDLCFVGRLIEDKGPLDAIEIARRSGRRLRIAAKVGVLPAERAYYEDVFRPALARADVEFLGELRPEDRDRLMAGSFAFLLPGTWPEPFGLVTIEALACGTPVVARPSGATPEIVRDGVDGFLGADVPAMVAALDRVPGLDRGGIAASVRERFNATRMAEGYEAVFRAATGP